MADYGMSGIPRPGLRPDEEDMTSDQMLGRSMSPTSAPIQNASPSFSADKVAMSGGPDVPSAERSFDIANFVRSKMGLGPTTAPKESVTDPALAKLPPTGTAAKAMATLPTGGQSGAEPAPLGKSSMLPSIGGLFGLDKLMEPATAAAKDFANRIGGNVTSSNAKMNNGVVNMNVQTPSDRYYRPEPQQGSSGTPSHSPIPSVTDMVGLRPFVNVARDVANRLESPPPVGIEAVRPQPSAKDLNVPVDYSRYIPDAKAISGALEALRLTGKTPSNQSMPFGASGAPQAPIGQSMVPGQSVPGGMSTSSRVETGSSSNIPSPIDMVGARPFVDVFNAARNQPPQVKPSVRDMPNLMSLIESGTQPSLSQQSPVKSSFATDFSRPMPEQQTTVENYKPDAKKIAAAIAAKKSGGPVDIPALDKRGTGPLRFAPKPSTSVGVAKPEASELGYGLDKYAGVLSGAEPKESLTGTEKFSGAFAPNLTAPDFQSLSLPAGMAEGLSPTVEQPAAQPSTPKSGYTLEPKIREYIKDRYGLEDFEIDAALEERQRQYDRAVVAQKAAADKAYADKVRFAVDAAKDSGKQTYEIAVGKSKVKVDVPNEEVDWDYLKSMPGTSFDYKKVTRPVNVEQWIAANRPQLSGGGVTKVGVATPEGRIRPEDVAADFAANVRLGNFAKAGITIPKNVSRQEMANLLAQLYKTPTALEGKSEFSGFSTGKPSQQSALSDLWNRFKAGIEASDKRAQQAQEAAAAEKEKIRQFEADRDRAKAAEKEQAVIAAETRKQGKKDIESQLYAPASVSRGVSATGRTRGSVTFNWNPKKNSFETTNIGGGTRNPTADELRQLNAEIERRKARLNIR